MPTMIDPSIPMADFQQELSKGAIDLHPCRVDPTLFVHYDQPLPGQYRQTFVRLAGQNLTAFLMVAPADPYKGLHCFAVGCATPLAYRGKGHAKEILRAAIAELKFGASEFSTRAFYMDACVSRTNIASQRLAESVFETKGKPVIDALSGEPAFQYFLLVEVT